MSKRTLLHLTIITGLLALLYYNLQYFFWRDTGSPATATSGRPTGKEGAIQFITRLYDTAGNQRASDTITIYYRDSTLIQHITAAVTTLDFNGAATVSHPTLFCRYLDLRQNAEYDYKTFTDTATLISKSVLSANAIKQYGWPFNTEEALAITGEPESITDTTMEGVYYKRFRFTLANHNPRTEYSIGYFNCIVGHTMLSIEKTFSRKIDCNLVKLYDYAAGIGQPYGSMEMKPVTDELSAGVTKIFDAWQQRAKIEPVR